jgi:signal peptidase I
MKQTLLPGDRILAQMFPLPVPERGKMILFFSPTDRGQILIKRVIAVPGDHLRIEGDDVILNGTTLDEKYANHEGHRAKFYPVNFPNEVELPGCAEGHEMLSQHVANGEIVVPAGSYFVLGDEPENSLDSRCWGFVNSSAIIGKPIIIYDSFEGPTDEASGPNPGFPRHRRWARLFKFL